MSQKTFWHIGMLLYRLCSLFNYSRQALQRQSSSTPPPSTHSAHLLQPSQNVSSWIPQREHVKPEHFLPLLPVQRTKLQFSQLSEQLGQANVQLEHSLKPQSWLHAGPLYSPLSFGQFKQQLQRSQVLKSQPQ